MSYYDPRHNNGFQPDPRSYAQGGQVYPPQVQPEPQAGFGLGDIIAGITRFFGIQPCEPCKRRQEAMNRWLRFRR